MLRPGGARAIVAENLLLKQQLLVIARTRQRAPNLQPIERFIFGLLSLLLPRRRIPRAAIVVRPSTFLHLHAVLVRRKYRDLFAPRSRGKPGPKGPSTEVIAAIVETKRRNPTFGCPHIALIINRLFGIEIDKDVVRRVLAHHLRPGPGDGSSWLTFIGHMKDSLWSVDLFLCESISLRSHWIMVAMDQFFRKIVGFSVHAGRCDGVIYCRMFNGIVSGKSTPKYLRTDNDPLFLFHRWKANLRIIDVTEIKSVPATPTSHPFIERTIGSVRRECLDQMLFLARFQIEVFRVPL